MKTYQSHKKVKAAKIIEVQDESNGENTTERTLTFHLSNGQSRIMLSGDKMLARGVPVAGDYLVEYEDGYQSFSPRKAFEEGYREVVEDARPTMTFHNPTGHLFSVMADGTLERGPAFTTNDEMSLEFWRLVDELRPKPQEGNLGTT